MLKKYCPYCNHRPLPKHECTDQALIRLAKYIMTTTQGLIISDIKSKHFDKTKVKKEFLETLETALTMIDDN